ncbi:MAG TPA: hypothetical protein V6D17_18530 [Candidatus Obscuribacterales bacterium]
MTTQTSELSISAATGATPQKTFRQLINGLLDHIMSRLDLDTGTERHEQSYLMTANLLDAASQMLDAYDRAEGHEIMPASSIFTVESGMWDQTDTLQRLATEVGVTCSIRNNGKVTTVDLTSVERAKVRAFIDATINQSVADLKNNETFESA